MIVETTQEYMARKGIKRGDLITGDVVPVTIVETTEAYMARKGIEPGQPIVSDPDGAGLVIVESHLDYLARKAAGTEPDTDAESEPKASKGAAGK